MSEIEMNILFLSQDEKFPDRGDRVPKVGQRWGTVLKQAPHTEAFWKRREAPSAVGL
jgi:hypothetical protein